MLEAGLERRGSGDDLWLWGLGVFDVTPISRHAIVAGHIFRETKLVDLDHVGHRVKGLWGALTLPDVATGLIVVASPLLGVDVPRGVVLTRG